MMKLLTGPTGWRLNKNQCSWVLYWHGVGVYFIDELLLYMLEPEAFCQLSHDLARRGIRQLPPEAYIDATWRAKEGVAK